MTKVLLILLLSISMLSSKTTDAPEIGDRIIVAADGSGDFTSIQQALDNLPESAEAPRTIFIKAGEYREKIFIKKANIILEGEDWEKTILIQSIARDAWRCEHSDDWGVATMNVGADNITLKNLTVTNDYGFTHADSETIVCASAAEQKKVVPRSGHQMALRTMNATRLKAIHCQFRAFGGDTVSPWEVNTGQWYFKDCIMEGGVDFYCPRGWAWAENCHFIAHSGEASIWHDGSGAEDEKTVLLNCRFSGFDGFYLGRYHRDAQFYLLHCRFDDNMADKPIYHAASGPELKWGERIYYYDCHRQDNPDFSWMGDHLPEGVSPDAISPDWVFNNTWQPQKKN